VIISRSGNKEFVFREKYYFDPKKEHQRELRKTLKRKRKKERIINLFKSELKDAKKEDLDEIFNVMDEFRKEKDQEWEMIKKKAEKAKEFRNAFGFGLSTAEITIQKEKN